MCPLEIHEIKKKRRLINNHRHEHLANNYETTSLRYETKQMHNHVSDYFDEPSKYARRTTLSDFIENMTSPCQGGIHMKTIMKRDHI